MFIPRLDRIRRSTPVGSDLHVDALATNVAGVYWQKYTPISSLVFPAVPQNKQSGKYAVYNKGDLNRIEARKRAAGTPAARGGWRVTTSSTFYCDRFDLGYAVLDDDADNADEIFDLENDATKYVTSNVALLKEDDFASTAWGTGKWGTDKTGGTDFTRWDQALSDPIADIRGWKSTLKTTCGFRPNVGVFGADSWDLFIDHPVVVDRLKHTSSNIPTAAIAAALLELDEVYIFDAVKTTTAEGASTTTLAQIATADGFLLLHRSPVVSKDMPTAGVTMTWNSRGRNRDGLKIKKFRDEDIEGTVVEASLACDHVIVASDMGLYATDIKT